MPEIDRDALITLYNNTVAKLNALMLDPNKHKVSYDIDGQRVNWTEYQKFLCDCLKQYKDQIDASVGPWEIEQTIIT